MSTTVEIILKGLDQVTPMLKSVQSTANSVAKDLGGTFEKVGQGMTEVGGAMTKLTAPLTLAGGAAVKLSMDLNSAMGDVATLIPGATDKVIELKSEVQQLAIDVGKSTQDIAGGLYEVMSAFGDGPDSMQQLTIAAKAATAGVATTKDSIALLSSVTKGYGDTSVTAVQQTADLAFMAAKLGQTTFPELARSMGSVVPLAAGLGVKNTELFGIYAALTGVTGSASEVSTQFRGILQALMAPTKDMADLLSDMGFESGNAMLQQLGLSGTISAIVKKAQDAGLPLQSYISSIEGQTAAMALAGPQAKALSDDITAMTQASGAADEAFRAKTEGVNAAGFAWSQFQQKMTVTAQQLGDQLAPALMGLLQAIQPILTAVQGAVTWFAGLDTTTQRVILAIIGIVVAIGPVLVGLGQVVSAIGVLIPVVQSLGVALQFLSANPIGAIIMAIAAVIAIGVLLYQHWDEVKAMAIQIWTAVADFFTNLWHGIAGFFIGIWTSITNGITAAWNAIVDWFKEWWGTILIGVFTGGIGLIVALIVANWDSIKQFTIDAWNAVLDFFRNLWPNIKQAAIDGMTALATWLVDKATGIKDNWTTSWNAILGFFRNLWPNIKQAAIDGVTALATWLVDKVTEIRNMFTGLWDGVLDFMKGLPSRMVQAGADIITGLARGIASVKIPIPTISVSTVEGPLGINIPKIGFGVDWRSIGDVIPWLASGGITTHAMIAGIGEAGREAILPLDQIVPLMARAIDQTGGAAGQQPIIRIDMRNSQFLDGRDAVGQIRRGLESRGFRLGEA